MNEFDKGWLVGLLEGEASFYRATRGYIIVQLRMTDEDTVARAASLLEAKYLRVHPPSWRRRGWSAQFEMRIQGKRAIALLSQLGKHFSDRRQNQIRLLGVIV